MLAVMSTTRVRMVVQVPERIRQLLRVEAAKRGRDSDMGAIITELVEQAYSEQLAEADDHPGDRKKKRD